MIRDTVCRLCSSCCPIEAEVRDKRLVRAWRKSFLDPDKRLPCAKLAAAPEIVYSPLRLTRPLIRDDRKADFREAGWDEALDRVAGLMRQHRERSGARSVAWLRGMAADWGAPWDYPNRLMHGFGSPNTIGNGSICFVGREFAHTYTYGSMAFPEAKNAKLIIVWGKNDGNTALGAAESIHWAREHGARLVVIDPVRTALADKADLWLPIRPGHDGLLAMAMIHEMISYDLFDADFVANHTVGFDALKEVAARYPAERVAAELWLEPEQVRDLARSYATVKPASIIDGNGLDMHREMFDTTRAIAMLRALTGNLDKPGAPARAGAQYPAARAAARGCGTHHPRLPPVQHLQRDLGQPDAGDSGRCHARRPSLPGGDGDRPIGQPGGDHGRHHPHPSGLWSGGAPGGHRPVHERDREDGGHRPARNELLREDPAEPRLDPQQPDVPAERGDRAGGRVLAGLADRVRSGPAAGA